MTLFNKTIDGLLGDFSKLADKLDTASVFHAQQADAIDAEIGQLQAEAAENKAQATRALKAAVNIRKLLAA